MNPITIIGNNWSSKNAFRDWLCNPRSKDSQFRVSTKIEKWSGLEQDSQISKQWSFRMSWENHLTINID